MHGLRRSAGRVWRGLCLGVIQGYKSAGDAPATGLPSAGSSGFLGPTSLTCTVLSSLQAAEDPSTLTLGLLPSSELMEVQHFRTIYHMFIAGLCVLIISTLAIDFIDEGR